MKRFGIIGDPVAHSMSPRLFTAAYHGLYPYDLIEGGDFDTSWERFLKEYDGINVTAPFKEKAFRAVDVLSPEAERIGAVNLVVKAPGGKTTGYNSDYDGVRLALLEAGLGGISGKALVIGCGGAGKAAAAAALDLGFDLLLTNRGAERAAELARRLGGRSIPIAGLRETLQDVDLILYTIPGPLDGFPLAEISGYIDDGKPRFLLEANYRDPVFTPQAEQSHASDTISLPPGCRYISGRRWLLHQAAAGYIRFTGEAPDTSAIAAAI